MKFNINANFQMKIGKKAVDFKKGELDTTDKDVIESLKKSKYATEAKESKAK